MNSRYPEIEIKISFLSQDPEVFSGGDSETSPPWEEGRHDLIEVSLSGCEFTGFEELMDLPGFWSESDPRRFNIGFFNPGLDWSEGRSTTHLKDNLEDLIQIIISHQVSLTGKLDLELTQSILIDEVQDYISENERLRDKEVITLLEQGKNPKSPRLRRVLLEEMRLRGLDSSRSEVMRRTS